MVLNWSFKVTLWLTVLLGLGVRQASAQYYESTLPDAPIFYAFGDSITAGLLSDYTAQPQKVSHYPGPKTLKRLLALPVGVIKDIDQPGRALVEAFESRGRSWFDGRFSFGSLLDSLGRGRPWTSVNLAVSGAESRDLDSQLRRMPAGRDLRNSLITIVVGANDLCAKSFRDIPTAEQFERNLRKVVDPLKDRGGRIVLALSPDVSKLQQVMGEHQVPYARGVIRRRYTYSCRWVWQKLQLCPTATMTDGAQLALLKRRGQQFWDRMKSLEDSQLKATDSLWNLDFEPKDLSIDCFHPSGEGQNKIANALKSQIPTDWY